MSDPDRSELKLISASMIRAARGLLDMSQTELGKQLTPAVSRRTISKIETETPGRPDQRRRDVHGAIRIFLESQGIEFLFGDELFVAGVRLRRASARDSGAEEPRKTKA